LYFPHKSRTPKIGTLNKININTRWYIMWPYLISVLWNSFNFVKLPGVGFDSDSRVFVICGSYVSSMTSNETKTISPSLTLIFSSLLQYMECHIEMFMYKSHNIVECCKISSANSLYYNSFSNILIQDSHTSWNTWKINQKKSWNKYCLRKNPLGRKRSVNKHYTCRK